MGYALICGSLGTMAHGPFLDQIEVDAKVVIGMTRWFAIDQPASKKEVMEDGGGLSDAVNNPKSSILWVARYAMAVAETALTRVGPGEKLRVDPSPLKELKEALLHRDDEIHELRQVIAMKDGIIRSLGEKLGSAETATQVISMKDQVIRQQTSA
eukprot:s1128_g8.t1